MYFESFHIPIFKNSLLKRIWRKISYQDYFLNFTGKGIKGNPSVLHICLFLVKKNKIFTAVSYFGLNGIAVYLGLVIVNPGGIPFPFSRLTVNSEIFLSMHTLFSNKIYFIENIWPLWLSCLASFHASKACGLNSRSGLHPLLGVFRRQPVDVSLSYWCFSFFPSLLPSF